MRYLVIDTETEALAPQHWRSLTPPAFVAAGYVASWLGSDVRVTQDYQEARAIVGRHLADPGVVVVGHNLAYDLWVLGLIPEPGSAVHDTQIADLLQRLARDDCDADKPGPALYRSLESLHGRPMAGKGSTQLTYAPGRPLTAEQRRYLEADVRATEGVYRRQDGAGVPGGYREMCLQLRAAMALRQLEGRGLPVDIDAVRESKQRLQAERARVARDLQRLGYYEPERVGPRGGVYKAHLRTEPFARHVETLCEAPPRTPTGRVKTDRAALQDLTDDPVVALWCDYRDTDKMIGTFLTAWEDTGGVIHPRYRAMVRTGRCSCYAPNLQQIPSRGARGEVRRVFVPPAGRGLWELDYCQLELCTLAYLNWGGRMRSLINAGKDLHRELGAIYYRVPAEQVTREERQLMKCASFGLPGGMGTAKFRSFIRANGLPDPGEAVAIMLRNAWLEAFPEMAAWLRHPVSSAYSRIWAGREGRWTQREIDEAWAHALALYHERKMPHKVYDAIHAHAGAPWVERWLSGRTVTVVGGRTRHPVGYSEALNTPFQGLAANLAKTALASVVLDYTGDCQVHAFIHDSLLISTPPGEEGETVVSEVAQLMLDAAKIWIPGVRAGVEICGPGANWLETKRTKRSVYVDNLAI